MNVILVAHDIRSTHNVGAFFRTCDGLGVSKIIFSGYTPFPTFEGDSRLPHFADKITRQIHKTALGAESSVLFDVFQTLEEALANFKKTDVVLVALEQAKNSLSPETMRQKLIENNQNKTVALIVGNEIHGVDNETLNNVDFIMEIPMFGAKESLNVSVATAIALYELTRPT